LKKIGILGGGKVKAIARGNYCAIRDRRTHGRYCCCRDRRG
jgi:hypothetical protein